MFNSTNAFPITSPVVTFTGLIVGSGLTLLHDEATEALGNIQKKCCGFVQLSTYINPEKPTKLPFKGYHPFQVFVIFPIHAKPWSSFCKAMMNKQETNFQPDTYFFCTGKVAGFLDHNMMTCRPRLTKDLVFIIVPDSWKFHEKTISQNSIWTTPSATKITEQPATDPYDRAAFMSISKRATQQPTTPATTSASFTSRTPRTESTILIPSCLY